MSYSEVGESSRQVKSSASDKYNKIMILYNILSICFNVFARQRTMQNAEKGKCVLNALARAVIFLSVLDANMFLPNTLDDVMN